MRHILLRLKNTTSVCIVASQVVLYTTNVAGVLTPEDHDQRKQNRYDKSRIKSHIF